VGWGFGSCPTTPNPQSPIPMEMKAFFKYYLNKINNILKLKIKKYIIKNNGKRK